MNANPVKHVCVIEDHQDYRRALQLAINQSKHLDCKLSFSSIEACLEGTAATMKPDVILLDLGLPGMHGVEGIPELRRRFPNAKILVLTVYDHKPVVLEALPTAASPFAAPASPGPDWSGPPGFADSKPAVGVGAGSPSPPFAPQASWKSATRAMGANARSDLG